MKKYAYKVVAAGRGVAFSFTSEQREKAITDLETQLNELGCDGWELVQQAEGIFYFKREIG